MRRLVVALVAVALVLVLAGCGGGDQAAPADTPASAPAAAPAAPGEAPPVALSENEPPVFSEFPTSSAVPKDLRELVDAKQPTLIYFYDSSQKTSKETRKLINSVIEKNRGLVELVAYDVGKYVSSDAAKPVTVNKKFAKDPKYQQAVELAQLLDVSSTPFVVLTDGQGYIIWKFKGWRTGTFSSARSCARRTDASVRSLFDDSAANNRTAAAPLAARMRPRTIEEFVGQQDVVGEGTWLRRAIDADALFSLILYGPAGTGKTSLARVIAGATRAHFEEVSAITGGVADLRTAIAAAHDRLGLAGQRTILFVDEIHRFSKSQQDALLHAVEDRIVVLIGATTENPFFEVNAPLVSRSRIVELTTLSDEDIRALVAKGARRRARIRRHG